MKIAIVTLPLNVNYGGILQAYALKSMLEAMGHEVTILDLKDKIWKPVWWKAPAIYMKRLVVKLLKGSSAPEVFRESRLERELPIVSRKLAEFVADKMNVRSLKTYAEVKEGEYDAFVVGSDQVWRPSYAADIYDNFLAFTKDWDVVRVAYAASFGTSELEFEYTQLEICAELLSRFNAVSVREDAAVRMCDEWLDCDRAVHVLDPVMFLTRDQISDLTAGQDSDRYKGKVVSYILDRAPHKFNVLNFVCRALQKDSEDVSAYPADASISLDDRLMRPLEEWLAAFASSEFIVTDSFHGCVLSILLHKPFLVVGNRSRGVSRIESLLKIFDLEYRLVDAIDPDDDGQGWLTEVDWDRVDEILNDRKIQSLSFLSESL